MLPKGLAAVKDAGAAKNAGSNRAQRRIISLKTDVKDKTWRRDISRIFK